MKTIAEMSIAEVAAFVSTGLRERGIDTVLSGGSCVAIYSGGLYVSKDLDFIDTGFATNRQIREAMLAMGFVHDQSLFTHPETEMLVDFPRGPLSVGKEPVGAVHEISFATGLLRILSPTDCVKDRLAAFYHWNDLQCLEQAVLVARSSKVNMNEVARWSEHEKVGSFRLIQNRFV